MTGEPIWNRRLIATKIGFWFVLLAALAAATTAPNSGAGGQQPPYPNALAVLGHSGATGTNSWATSTNPAVNSVYLRILAKNPRIKRQNVNLAQGAATVRELLLQAEQAVALKPQPDLILIQILENDIVCPPTAKDYAAFRSGFELALRTLARRAPRSNVFVVSAFGSPGTWAKSLTLGQRRAVGGTRPCDVTAPEGRIVARKAAAFDKVIHGYESQLKAACGRRRCHYDNGAFGNVVDRREYNALDGFHLSVQGQAKAAAVAWSALQRAGLVPRTG